MDEALRDVLLGLSEDREDLALLDDAAVFHDGDAVTDLLDDGHLVRDDDDRDAELLVQVLQQPQDRLGGLGVERRGRLVEDHDGRVGDRRSGYGYKLALTLREVCAVVGKLGLIALGKARDEVVRAGELCRGDALFIRCAELAVADVVHHRAGEQVGVLQHDAQRAAQVGFFDLVDVDAVVADLALLNIVETVDQVGDGGLARAGGADEGDLLAGLGVKGNVMQTDFSGT